MLRKMYPGGAALGRSHLEMRPQDLQFPTSCVMALRAWSFLWCFQSQWKMYIYYFILLSEYHHLSVLWLSRSFETYIPVGIKPWASNTSIWCDHISSLLRGNLICFPGIHFPTNYFRKHMLFHRARYQNFINIWFNMKSHGIILSVCELLFRVV